MKQFERLFEPRSIAAVGVSEDAARPGSQTVHALLRNRYPGRIYPVNPKYPTYEGMTCYPSVSAIEGEVDVAVIGVPARGVIGVIEDCAKKRVPFVVVPSGGFRESGPEGAERQARMLAIAREAGMRIVGPNCLGLVNVHKDVYAGFGSITRPPALEKGSVSLVTQSGGFGYSIALACQQVGIGFRNIIATGNEADIGAVEFIDALLEDPETRVILAYIEGLGDARRLLDCGKRALAAGKPLIVWKAGITREGARAAASHTASMTGSYDYYRALFRQAGIVEIREIHEAVDYIKAFDAWRFPAGRRVAAMGGSGGSAIVFADAAEQAGLTFGAFTEKTRQRLAKVIPEVGSVDNPVDFTAGYIAGGNAENFGVAVKAVLDDPHVDALCLNFATTAGAACHVGAGVLRSITAGTAKPLFVFLSTPASEAGAALPVLDEAKIPVLPSPVRVARAIAMLSSYREAQERQFGAFPPPAAGAASNMASYAPAHSGGTLSEADSKAILAGIGIPVTRDVLVKSAADVRFETFSPPLVVKIASSGIPHKTEVGGVRLDIRTAEALEAAIVEVLSNARTLAPDAQIDGVIVSEMVTGGFELIAGVVNDAVFGPVVVVGAGGIDAEVLVDTSCRLAPIDERAAREMLDELKCRPILDGMRGRPALDVAAVARCLAALSQYAWHNRHTIAEIDVNPLFALPAGAVAADALIVFSKIEGGRP
ncbi:MAG: acetate--CoA ligase family protein [Burkholderiales bacterium]